MFKLTTDPARRLLEISFESLFWDMDVARRFKDACADAVTSLGCAPGTHLVLVDLREGVLQSQAVFDQLIHMVRISLSPRMALVADTPLARMQTKRLQVRDTVRMFTTMDEARAWLFQPVADAKAA